MFLLQNLVRKRFSNSATHWNHLEMLGTYIKITEQDYYISTKMATHKKIFLRTKQQLLARILIPWEYKLIQPLLELLGNIF